MIEIQICTSIQQHLHVAIKEGLEVVMIADQPCNVCLCVCLSVCLCVCLSVCLSVCPPLCFNCHRCVQSGACA
jgi:hypothetical protein